jgi:ribosomal protein S18 acetylase RimI-like enzyme
MMFRLERADLADVEGIAAVVYEVWELTILPEVCQAQIQGDASALWIARDGRAVVGFASAFLTPGRDGRRRWELDLLAVCPASQRRGLGQALIGRVCEDGERQGAAVVRAAVRVDNVLSQRAFERTGFSTDGRTHRLLLWGPQDGAVTHRSLSPVSLIPVDTLTYRGLWLEGLDQARPSTQRAAVQAARATVAQEHRLNAGALVPLTKEPCLARDLRDEAAAQGVYYSFVRPCQRSSDERQQWSI